jgi:hypothetical protein
MKAAEAGNPARSRLLVGFLGRLVPRRSRLKAGCSQDWLPHDFCRQQLQEKLSGIVLEAGCGMKGRPHMS